MKSFLNNLLLGIYKANEQTEPEPLRIIHKNEEQQLFYSVVMEPWTDVTATGDTHGHRITAEEIEKAMHSFMLNGATIKKSHRDVSPTTKVVEIFAAPVDYTAQNGELIQKGSWVMGVKVLDSADWQDVKDGKYRAFSPGGRGKLKDL